MALPEELKTEKVNAVSAAIGKMSPKEIGALPSLEDEDFKLFGKVTQTYCFIDFNLRRALEVMHLGKRLPPEDVKRYPHYSDAELTEILCKCVKRMDPAVENLAEASFRLEELSRCRGYRNLVSHFAAKRYPNEDVYVFASKSERDAKKAMGRNLKAHHVHFAVAGRSEFFQLAKLLDEHQLWLAQKIPEWDAHYVQDEAASKTNQPL